MSKDKRIAVAMSGGIDSSAVAYFLKESGYEVIGLTMKQLGDSNNIETVKSCCSLEDITDAKLICDELGIPHYTVNLSSEFKTKVVDYFVDSYIKGFTPNPCVICNREIKLGALLDAAINLGAEKLATGHYAIIKDGNLYVAKDLNKDQSYFLAQLSKAQLSRLMFPLGEYTKDEVRLKLANLSNLKKKIALKRESTGVCFIKNNDYKQFVSENSEIPLDKPGDIVDKEGNVIGQHSGIHAYTLGQRKGIGIAAELPYYVSAIDYSNNTITVGLESDLYSSRLICSSANFIAVDKESVKGIRCQIKTRARDDSNWGLIYYIGNGKVEVKFDNGVRAITPGQLAVFFAEDGLVLGSGFIEQAFK